MGRLQATAPTKESLEKVINEHFFSTGFIITDDLRVFNTIKNKYIDYYTVTCKRGRWRLEEI